MKSRNLIKKSILCTICCIIALSFAMIVQTVYAEGIENPVYDPDTGNSTYSYVYFGHYPQSEISGNDLSEDITGANYNKYGVATVNRQQIFRKDVGEEYHYYLVEPIKWKVLNIDDNYMLLQTDKIIARGIDYYGYDSDNGWKKSDLRSWLNGYDYDKNSSSKDYTADFENFKSVAFTEDEYDICQLIDFTRGGITTSDYVIIPSYKMVTNTSYGFKEVNGNSFTREKTATDYASGSNGWCLIDSYGVDSSGHFGGYRNFEDGVAPVVKVLINSDQYYTSKPELTMGTDISDASISLKYNSTDYTGKEKKPAVTVKMGNNTLTKDADYTVNYSDNVDGGNGKVTISGCGKYYGSVEKSFTINRINQKISRVYSSYTKAIGDKAFRLNATTSGNGAITYSSSDTSVVIAAQNTGKITIVGMGTATVTITASETKNYNEAKKTVEIVVLPKNVTNLKQSSSTTSSIKLSWSKISGASGYEIYRYSPTQEEYKRIKIINSGKTSSFVNSKLSSGKTYKYKIRAFVKKGSKKYYGNFSTAKSTATKPKKTSITKMKFLIGARGSVNIKYKKVSCTGYEILYAKNSKFKGGTRYRTKKTSYSIMENSSGTFYAKVRPYKTCGGKVYYGSWSKAKKVKSI